MSRQPAECRGAAEPAQAGLHQGRADRSLETMDKLADPDAAARASNPAVVAGPAPPIAATPAADPARNVVRPVPARQIGLRVPQDRPPALRGRPPARTAGAGPPLMTAVGPGAPPPADRMRGEQVREPDNRPVVDARTQTSLPRILATPPPGVARIRPLHRGLVPVGRRAATIGAAATTPPGPTLVAAGLSEALLVSVATALDPRTPICAYRMSPGFRRSPRMPTSRYSTVRCGPSCAH
jgi:hypothetical protein